MQTMGTLAILQQLGPGGERERGGEGGSMWAPTHEAQEGQMRDDGLHHLSKGVPSRLVPVSLTSTVTIVIISIREVTK